MALDSLSEELSPVPHRKCGLLKHQLQLIKRQDCNRYEIAPISDPLSFDKGFFIFVRACQLLTQKMEGVVLVGLAGPSGAGKTVFSEKVSSFLPGAATISMDNYNDSTRIIDGNYDDPRLTDYDTLLENIHNLRAGKAVEVPIYDFKLSKRVGYRKLEVPSSRIVIIEGIYALSERLRPLLDLRVSITGGVHFDLVKRVLRDINRSGQEPEEIIHQISETVYPMYKAFIEPDLITAQIKIVNKFNPFSGFQNPTYILKSLRSISAEQVKEVLAEGYRETIEETYDIYLLPPGEDPETCQSYLRMRNRDGKYSLMFEEWVTDNPFIISPRITFEVSVRLLGGLMALGYQMATILKRVSHVFFDEKITIKMDKLEQLHRKYVQVQGKDRSLVAEIAKKVGLDGSYVPHSYIEQIQLEKLTAEVTALPEDLKSKLSLNDKVLSSSISSFSWISEAKPGARKVYTRSWTCQPREALIPRKPSHQSDSMRIDKAAGKPNGRWMDNGKRYDDKGQESPVVSSDQLASVNERLDEIFCRVGELESSLPVATSNGHHRQSAPITALVGSSGTNAGNLHANGNAAMNGHCQSLSGHTVPLFSDATLLEEVKILSRGHRHITTQLDVLASLLRDNQTTSQQKRSERRKLEGFLGNMRTSNTGLASALGFLVLGASGLTAIIATKMLRRNT
ncbi:hypothetical protein O6H91_03G083200 [Diphasiastrum complanatum]|uniref:Uncharacterized protein n=1 Tax=Diphasiastrum complanatum TaxID=34168 RepID=A0ACC2E917_DIPCM|nr:hypothetical protein O6H91_03G083200 [Diphasiastrum complanatum]